MIINLAKPKDLTLKEFLKELENENNYIKRITQIQGLFIVETGYNLEAKKRWSTKKDTSDL